jgi:NADH:ubiquinone oxidoreductase subunit 3 (subunit A)
VLIVAVVVVAIVVCDNAAVDCGVQQVRLSNPPSPCTFMIGFMFSVVAEIEAVGTVPLLNNIRLIVFLGFIDLMVVVVCVRVCVLCVRGFALDWIGV